jgi:hypothetical protein
LEIASAISLFVWFTHFLDQDVSFLKKQQAAAFMPANGSPAGGEEKSQK